MSSDGTDEDREHCGQLRSLVKIVPREIKESPSPTHLGENGTNHGRERRRVS